MNNRYVLCSDDRPNAVPSGSPLPLFFRCIADQQTVIEKERPLIAGAFFCLKSASPSFESKEKGE